jgi:hypothetical protein
MPPLSSLPVLAMSPIAAFATAASLCLLIGGLVLLFLGIKLIRPVCILLCATVGGLVGQRVAVMTADQVSLPGWPWIAAIGGAVVLGVLGLLLYRIWVVLTFGVLLSAGAAAGLLWMTGGADFANIRSDSITLATDVGEVFTLASDVIDAIQQGTLSADESQGLRDAMMGFAKGESKLTPEQVRKLDSQFGNNQGLLKRLHSLENLTEELPQRTTALGDRWVAVLKNNGVGLSIAAVVGLAVGLLLAGLNWRLAAVLMTSLAGLGLCLGALYLFAIFQKPEWVDRVWEMGWKAWSGAAGLWLMGASIQGLLARRKKAPPQAEPPVAAPAK